MQVLPYNMVKGYEPDRRINNLTKAEDGYTLLRGNSQQRYFSTLDEDDLNVKAGLVYRLKDNIEEISNVRFGYTGRFVDDNFKATEYNLTVGHVSTLPSLDNLSLDDYYNQENFASDWFKIQKNLDEYTVKKKYPFRLCRGYLPVYSPLDCESGNEIRQGRY